MELFAVGWTVPESNRRHRNANAVHYHCANGPERSRRVDPGGIEPPTLPCHGSVLPVYYGPNSLNFNRKLTSCKLRSLNQAAGWGGQERNLME